MTTKDTNSAADRPYPLMWDGRDYAVLPLASLTLDTVDVRIGPPYCVGVRFFSTAHELLVGRRDHGDCLVGRHILGDDVLIYDAGRTTPEDGAIMLVEDGQTWRPRVCRVLAAGVVEFHAAVAGYPILTGARRISGTLAAVIRVADGQDERAAAAATDVTQG